MLLVSYAALTQVIRDQSAVKSPKDILNNPCSVVCQLMRHVMQRAARTNAVIGKRGWWTKDHSLLNVRRIPRFDSQSLRARAVPSRFSRRNVRYCHRNLVSQMLMNPSPIRARKKSAGVALQSPRHGTSIVTNRARSPFYYMHCDLFPSSGQKLGPLQVCHHPNAVKPKEETRMFGIAPVSLAEIPNSLAPALP